MKKTKKIFISLILVVILVIVAYFVLPTQIPKGNYQNLKINDVAGEVSLEIQTDQSFLVKELKLIVTMDEKEDYKKEIKIESGADYKKYIIDGLAKGHYNIKLMCLSIAEIEFVSFEDKFEIVTGVQAENLEIHFFEFDNHYPGDSIYIKAGQTDILVDAGSDKGTAKVIKEYLNEQMTDNILEYVIITHADYDHIAAMIGTSEYEGIFESYEVKNLIDFPLTNKTTATYKEYVDLRKNEIETGAQHYPADYFFESGNSNIIELATGIEMEILDNYYYFNKATDENDYSVCFQIDRLGEKFLFTGDLEHDGEEKLIERNNLSQVYFFKAGHHGSSTSNNDFLLDVIQPEVVVIPTSAGSDKHGEYYDTRFPTQTMISTLSKYDAKVYVPSEYDDETDSRITMNGNIVISCVGNEINITFSGNNKELKDQDWFNEMIYVTEDNKTTYENKDGDDVLVTADYPNSKEVVRRFWG